MRAIATAQADLFGCADALPKGLDFVADFVTRAQERELIEMAASLPLHEARYKVYTARRRVCHWGARSDPETAWLAPGALDGLPPALAALRRALAGWAGVDAAAFVHVMVSEYRPGTPLGWHRDAPGHEVIVGVSLGGPARLRFRPWPPVDPTKGAIVALDLAPRSAYAIRGVARWGWQHSIPPVPALRYSVTLRTARASGGVGPRASDTVRASTAKESERLAFGLPRAGPQSTTGESR